MSQPIVLWNAQRHTNHVFDDAGISIAKTILAPPAPPAPYDPEPPNNLRTVPPLAYFCIRALTPYADQLHNLQHQIPYRRDVVRALIPSKVVPRDPLVTRKQDSQSKNDSDAQYSGFDVQSADPRLLATLAQVMHPLPAEFRDYEIPLSDGHLPLLQQVPSRENFSFVTLLALPGCKEVSDETIGVIRRLNTLAALDLRGTSIGSYGLTVLARGLSWSDDELQSRTGCWGLRILRLHSCTNIGNEALPILSKFSLLSSIDLRFTRCTRYAVLKHLAGFVPSSNRSLFHPAPLDVSLSALEHLSPLSIYSCPITSLFKLHVSELNHRTSSHEQKHHPSILRNLQHEEPISLIDSDSDEEYSGPIPKPVLQNVQSSTTSTIYASRLPRREHQIRAAVVDSNGTDKDQLHPLALARPPPPWSVLDTLRPPGRPHQLYDPQEEPPPPRLASMDHARLTKRNVSSMQDMVTSLTVKNKRRKVESEFTSTSARPSSVPKSRNPFLKSRASTSKLNGTGGMVRSVFAEQRDAATPPTTARQGKSNAAPWPKFCDAGPLKTATPPIKSTSNLNNTASQSSSKFPSSSNSRPPDISKPVEKTAKPPAKIMRPITWYPVPPCPPEHFLLVPQLPRKRPMVATRIVPEFPKSTVDVDGSDDIIEVEGIGSIREDDTKKDNNTKGDERPLKKAGMARGGTNTGKKSKGKGKRKETEFDWDKWRRVTM
ncbi:uncharacterized protein EDB91DRAFT_1342423 [Suillus paluster]|uniref:uncharacterized protein n=1 Tax=Suillus paluster TaxID=48578 RepID=UPI001B87E3E3|nr:uncharacterized protein EDB91DRAFT_1342423 [Suillus paluster]KAG1756797.1 hypothetical protein EDB91DRAFT_1342423 [Suillus paluster]